MDFLKPTRGKIILSIIFIVILLIFALPSKPNAYCRSGGECPPMSSLSFVPISAWGLFGLSNHYFAFSFTGFLIELIVAYIIAAVVIYFTNKNIRNA